MQPDEREHTEDVINRMVEDAGFEVLRLTVSARRHIVLTLDADPGPITMDDCVRMNRGARRALEEAGLPFEDYSIDVESPGTKRILNQLKHFERFRGMRALARLKEPTADGQRVVRGILKGVDGEKFVIAPEVGRPWKLTLDEISNTTLDPKE